jgi:hypothetical protein
VSKNSLWSRQESQDFLKGELNTTKESDSCFFAQKSFCFSNSQNNVSLVTRDTLVNELLQKVRSKGDHKEIGLFDSHCKGREKEESRGKNKFNIFVGNAVGNSGNLTSRNQILKGNSGDGTDLAKSTFFGYGKGKTAGLRQVLSAKTQSLIKRINTTLSEDKKIRGACRSRGQDYKLENLDSKPASVVDCDELDSLSSGPEYLKDEDFILTEVFRKKASKNNKRRRPKS